MYYSLSSSGSCITTSWLTPYCTTTIAQLCRPTPQSVHGNCQLQPATWLTAMSDEPSTSVRRSLVLVSSRGHVTPLPPHPTQRHSPHHQPSQPKTQMNFQVDRRMENNPLVPYDWIFEYDLSTMTVGAHFLYQSFASATTANTVISVVIDSWFSTSKSPCKSYLQDLR
jgi:hypothetical protein